MFAVVDLAILQYVEIPVPFLISVGSNATNGFEIYSQFEEQKKKN